MYTSVPGQHVPYSWLFRWCARAGGAIVVVAWLVFVLVEAARPVAGPPSIAAYYQAAALALVFAGYALGWQKELAGGVLTIVGTIAFFAVHVLTFGMLPGLEAAWFTTPGVLYLLAWKYDERRPDATVQP